MKENKSHSFEDLKEFVIRHYWNIKSGLTRETRVSEDLQIEGDDADEFMQKFSEEFKVDLSDFEFEGHFKFEGFDPIGFSRVVRKLRGDKIYKEKALSITLGDLEKSMIAGRWINP
jgi:hypothetical protein